MEFQSKIWSLNLKKGERCVRVGRGAQVANFYFGSGFRCQREIHTIELNFFRRLLSVETFYSIKSDSKDGNGPLTEETLTTRQKYGATLYFSPYRKFNKTFSIGLGYQLKRDDIEKETGANEREVLLKNKDSSPLVKLRYRKSFEDSGWGYEINIKFEDKDNLKNNTAAIGFFYSF